MADNVSSTHDPGVCQGAEGQGAEATQRGLGVIRWALSFLLAFQVRFSLQEHHKPLRRW